MRGNWERGLRLAAAMLMALVIGGAVSTDAVGKTSKRMELPKGSFEYVTVYSGTFQMTNDWHSCGPDPCDNWSLPDNYQWIIMRTDRFNSDGGNKFTEINTVREQATGEADDVGTDTPLKCTVAATGSAYTSRRSGRYVVPANRPPVPVYWSVPGYTDPSGEYFYYDSVGQTPSTGIPRDGYLWAPGVQLNCTISGDGGSFNYQEPDGSALTGGVTPVGPTIPTLYDKVAADEWANHQFPSCGGGYLTPNADFYRLWDGSSDVKIESLPYERSFGFHSSINGTAGPGNFFDAYGEGSATCQTSVSYETNVIMYAAKFATKGIDVEAITKGRSESIPLPGSPSAEPPTPITGQVINGVYKPDVPVNKVGEALFKDGLAIMSGEFLPLTSTDTTGTILFPGMPEADTGTGLATLDVSGQVVSHSNLRGPLASAAATKQTLITGRATVPADSPSSIPIALTAAGKSVFTTTRTKPVTVQATLSFTPKGHHGKKISRTETLTVPPPLG